MIQILAKSMALTWCCKPMELSAGMPREIGFAKVTRDTTPLSPPNGPFRALFSRAFFKSSFVVASGSNLMLHVPIGPGILRKHLSLWAY
jgi:hypothetical protein